MSYYYYPYGPHPHHPAGYEYDEEYFTPDGPPPPPPTPSHAGPWMRRRAGGGPPRGPPAYGPRYHSHPHHPHPPHHGWGWEGGDDYIPRPCHPRAYGAFHHPVSFATSATQYPCVVVVNVEDETEKIQKSAPSSCPVEGLIFSSPFMKSHCRGTQKDSQKKDEIDELAHIHEVFQHVMEELMKSFSGARTSSSNDKAKAEMPGNIFESVMHDLFKHLAEASGAEKSAKGVPCGQSSTQAEKSKTKAEEKPSCSSNKSSDPKPNCGSEKCEFPFGANGGLEGLFGLVNDQLANNPQLEEMLANNPFFSILKQGCGSKASSPFNCKPSSSKKANGEGSSKQSEPKAHASCQEACGKNNGWESPSGGFEAMKGNGSRGPESERNPPRTREPACDFLEDADQYTLLADIPGVIPDHILVEIADESSLTIEGFVLPNGSIRPPVVKDASEDSNSGSEDGYVVEGGNLKGKGKEKNAGKDNNEKTTTTEPSKVYPVVRQRGRGTNHYFKKIAIPDDVSVDMATSQFHSNGVLEILLPKTTRSAKDGEEGEKQEKKQGKVTVPVVW
eukprot:Nk52_evm4s373 gene=Nk52_evmTU4s373